MRSIRALRAHAFTLCIRHSMFDNHEAVWQAARTFKRQDGHSIGDPWSLAATQQPSSAPRLTEA